MGRTGEKKKKEKRKEKRKKGKRREKGRKEGNSSKEGKYPYFVSLFYIGPYDRRNFFGWP